MTQRLLGSVRDGKTGLQVRMSGNFDRIGPSKLPNSRVTPCFVGKECAHQLHWSSPSEAAAWSKSVRQSSSSRARCLCPGPPMPY